MKSRSFVVLAAAALSVVFLVAVVWAAQQAPDTITMNSKVYAKHTKALVTLTHKKHNVDYKISCADCHHVYEGGNNVWKDCDPFSGFFAFSKWIYKNTSSTWQISLNRLTKLLFNYLVEENEFNKQNTADLLARDIFIGAGRKLPSFLREFVSEIPDIKRIIIDPMNKRQVKHK